MAQTSDAQSIQTQLREMDKMLMRVMAHLARTKDGQTSLIRANLF